MQLNQLLMETNLFNELSDQEQEVVSGGVEIYEESGDWGSIIRTIDGLSGSFRYIAPNGFESVASWGPDVQGWFQYSVIAPKA